MGGMQEVLCPHFEDHTPCPEGYISWHDWAEKMERTHTQSKCDGCGRYSIWTPKGQVDEGWMGDWQYDTLSERANALAKARTPVDDGEGRVDG